MERQSSFGGLKQIDVFKRKKKTKEQSLKNNNDSFNTNDTHLNLRMPNIVGQFKESEEMLKILFFLLNLLMRIQHRT